MKHPERLAAGMADINEMVLRYELPVSSPSRWPLGKLLANFACLALAMGALLAWGVVG